MEDLIPSWASFVWFQSDFIPNSHHLHGAQTQDGREWDHGLCTASAHGQTQGPQDPDAREGEAASDAGMHLPPYGSGSISTRIRRTGNILKPSMCPDLPQTLGLYHLRGLFAPTLEHSLHLVP